MDHRCSIGLEGPIREDDLLEQTKNMKEDLRLKVDTPRFVNPDNFRNNVSE